MRAVSTAWSTTSLGRFFSAAICVMAIKKSLFIAAQHPFASGHPSPNPNKKVGPLTHSSKETIARLRRGCKALCSSQNPGVTLVFERAQGPGEGSLRGSGFSHGAERVRQRHQLALGLRASL